MGRSLQSIANPWNNPQDQLAQVDSADLVNFTTDQPPNLILFDPAELETPSAPEAHFRAWKDAFGKCLARFRDRSGGTPRLVAVTQERSWESAQLALKFGVRELWHRDEVALQLHPKTQAHQTPGHKRAQYLKHTAATHAIPMVGIDGDSSFAEGLRSLLRKTLNASQPVLLIGPAGSGKEHMARILHRYSPRTDGAFVVLDADEVNADHGLSHLRQLLLRHQMATVYISGLEQLTRLTQSALEKALHDHQDEQRWRFIFGVARPPELLLESQTQDVYLKPELYFRISVYEIEIPRLRQRRRDIPAIVRSQLDELARAWGTPKLDLDSGAFEKLLLHPWPGELHELKQVIERSALHAKADQRHSIQLRDLPESLQNLTTDQADHGEVFKTKVRDFERRAIERVIHSCNGSKEEAANLLGLSLATLYRKLAS